MKKKRLSFFNVVIVVVGALFATDAMADQKIQDDLIVVGSECLGVDCNSGENFNFDTLRLKENNLRIRFMDTSSSSSFPSRDWQITVNESANGGANKFSIEDLDANTIPFTIEASAPSNSLYVDDGGRIGINTNTPLVNIHNKEGNSPTLRLEQDGSSGFSPQIWDVAGNEANFFVRDVTNGSKLPFKIVPNAPTNSLYIAADGDVGLGTATPDGIFDVADPSDANDHAFLISSVGNVGIGIANGFEPLAMLHIDGNALIGPEATGTSTLHVLATGSTTSLFVASDNGDVGFGTDSPDGPFHISRSGVVKCYTESSSNDPVQLRIKSNSDNRRVLGVDSSDTPQSQIIFGDDEFKLAGVGSVIFATFDSTGLNVNGAISTTVSGQVHPDYVFENDYKLESIEEHAAFMWKNKYLSSVGPGVHNEDGDAVINVSEKMMGVLEELEKAHIYIEQMHKRLSKKEAQNELVLQRLYALEARIKTINQLNNDKK